jgi:hypothetical protein
MEEPSLRGPGQKAGWAGEHLSWLTAEIRKFLARKEDTLTEYLSSTTGEARYEVSSHGPKLTWPGDFSPGDRSMLIGDFSYNERAALDHIAYQLV